MEDRWPDLTWGTGYDSLSLLTKALATDKLQSDGQGDLSEWYWSLFSAYTTEMRTLWRSLSFNLVLDPCMVTETRTKCMNMFKKKGVPSPRLIWLLPLSRPSWKKSQHTPLREDHSLKDLQLSASRMLTMDLSCYGKASFAFTGKDACFVH